MNTIPAITIGLNLGDKKHASYVINQTGAITSLLFVLTIGNPQRF